jgi:hypothetical protein
MTDAFTANDESDRPTYMHRYGVLVGERNPPSHPNDAGASNARRDDRLYWRIHELAWAEVTRVLKPAGTFALNAKNHIARGEEVLVVERHLGLLEALGYELEDGIFVPTSGHGGAGSNRECAPPANGSSGSGLRPAHYRHPGRRRRARRQGRSAEGRQVTVRGTETGQKGSRKRRSSARPRTLSPARREGWPA